jgi:hypothetical protein
MFSALGSPTSLTDAEPVSTLATVAAIAQVISPVAEQVQNVSAWLDVTSVFEGCDLDSEPFLLNPKAPEVKDPEKNRRLRPEGGDPKARMGTERKGTDEEEPPTIQQLRSYDLLELRRTGRGGRTEGILVVSLDGIAFAQRIVCRARVSRIVGFDTRVGNQAKIRIQSAVDGDHAFLICSGIYDWYGIGYVHFTCSHLVESGYERRGGQRPYLSVLAAGDLHLAGAEGVRSAVSARTFRIVA